MWEGGLRVPFVAWWPGKIPAGRVSDEFLTTLELLPTLAAAAGAKLPEGVKLDGYDMLPALAGETPSPRKEMFWEFRGQKAARVGQLQVDRVGEGQRTLRPVQRPRRKRRPIRKVPDVAADIRARWTALAENDGRGRAARTVSRLLGPLPASRRRIYIMTTNHVRLATAAAFLLAAFLPGVALAADKDGLLVQVIDKDRASLGGADAPEGRQGQAGQAAESAVLEGPFCLRRRDRAGAAAGHVHVRAGVRPGVSHSRPATSRSSAGATDTKTVEMSGSSI